MSKNAKDFFIVEVLAIIMSLTPLLLMWLTPRMVGEAMSEELFIFTEGLALYIVFPALSLLMSLIFAFLGMRWFISILAMPCALLFAATTYFPIGWLSVLVFGAAYGVIGMIVAWPVERYKKRKDEDAKYMGRKL
ncbi:MAG: hypothetical protein ACOX8S_05345 [Christensenellales bacterium]